MDCVAMVVAVAVAVAVVGVVGVGGVDVGWNGGDSVAVVLL